MTTGAALVVVLVAMAGMNVWVYVGPSRVHLVTGPSPRPPCCWWPGWPG